VVANTIGCNDGDDVFDDATPLLLGDADAVVIFGDDSADPEALRFNVNDDGDDEAIATIAIPSCAARGLATAFTNGDDGVVDVVFVSWSTVGDAVTTVAMRAANDAVRLIIDCSNRVS
jgi:hypothetical protein